jgi:hypothetical protein
MAQLRTRFVLALAAAMLAGNPTSPADAQPGGVTVPKLDLGKIKADLESGDEQRMLRALKQISEAGEAARAAAPHVDAVLRRGASTAIITAALQVAAALGNSSSTSAILPYMRHRSPIMRQAAAKALISTKGPEAAKALRRALRSSDAVLRGIAAGGLGQLGAKEAVGDLFLALERDVKQAAKSIGTLCGPSQCEKLAAQLGKVKIDAILEGFDEILFRPAKQVPDETKLAVITRLMTIIGTPAVARYVRETLERWPKDASKDVRDALEAAVDAAGLAGEKP